MQKPLNGLLQLLGVSSLFGVGGDILIFFRLGIVVVSIRVDPDYYQFHVD